MRGLRVRACAQALVLGIAVLTACRTSAEKDAASVGASLPAAQLTPVLPAGEAGQLVARAIAAAGGWQEWLRHRDASFVSTLTIFDPAGNAASETIFLHKMPLHQGMKTRLESIGLPQEVVFGFDGRESWMLRGGRAETALARTAFTRFHALSSLYWFHAPFVLAEIACELSYLGAERRGDRRWEKVRVTYADALTAPAQWMVFYFDADTGLIDQVHSQVEAEFLRHTLWVGRWRDYRAYDGIRKERRRMFYPAGADGAILGRMAAEQLVEHVRFDNGFEPRLFIPPPAAAGGSPAG